MLVVSAVLQDALSHVILCPDMIQLTDRGHYRVDRLLRVLAEWQDLFRYKFVAPAVPLVLSELR